MSRRWVGGAASQNCQSSLTWCLLSSLVLDVVAHFSVPFQTACANVTFSNCRASTITSLGNAIDNTGDVNHPSDAICRTVSGGRQQLGFRRSIANTLLGGLG